MAVQPVQISPALAAVLNRAGDKSNVDFNYLLQTAMRESSLNPEAKAPTSSATGLFQFIDSTWLEVMHNDGAELGYARYANAIDETPDGDYTVKDSGLRQEILALRENPQVSADLAAAFTRDNGQYLTERFGRQPSPGELYIAHFLGARGAEKLFKAGLDNPDQPAPPLFPRASRANPSIFYDSHGAKTVREVYRSLIGQHLQQTNIPTVTPVAAQVPPHQMTSTSPLPQSRYGPPVAPPPAVDFDALYSNQTSAPRTVVVDPGAALFVQLYGK